MQIFELYFNPKNKTKFSESFHHKPKDAYERKIGRLYMVGEIPDAQKKDSTLLQNIFHLAKESYYKDTSLPSERALKNTLKEINDFLKERDYAGKIDIAIFSSKNFSLCFGKTGNIKILLTNSGKTKDVGKELEDSSTGLFCNMVSGKMKRNDKLIVLTPEIYRFFVKEKIIQEISKNPLSEKTNEKIADLQKKKFPQASGVSFVMDHTFNIKEEGKKLISEERTKKFSFQKLFLQTLFPLTRIRFIKFKLPKKKISFSSLKVPSAKTFPIDVKKKSLLLPLLLFCVVVLGALTVGIEKRIRFGENKKIIQEISNEALSAKESGDLFLLEEAFLELKKIKEEESFDKETEDLYSLIEQELLSYSFLEEITDLEVITEIQKTSPERILFANGDLYLFSSLFPVVDVINLETKEIFSHNLPIEKGVESASFSGGKLLLFSKPQTIIFIENDQISQKEIDLPHPETDFVSLSSFFGNPYLLESNGNIYRYSDKAPLEWINDTEKRIENCLSIAIDESVFVLDKSGIIYRYYRGDLQENLNPYIFPSLKGSKKVYTSSPDSPLFVLDTDRNRFLTISKEGKTIKQFVSKEFDDLKDITIDFSGKKIYLLDNQKVYSIDL